jgi:hypothetical protein
VTPANPKAASFGGYAVATDLDLVVGHGELEFVGFARGSNIVRGASWQEELRWIWGVVVGGGFRQHHYFDSSGRLIAGSGKLVVKGKDLVFRSGRREKLFGRAYTREEVVTYEPYF